MTPKRKTPPNQRQFERKKTIPKKHVHKMKTSKKNGDDPKSLAELKIEYDPRNDNDPKEGKEGVGGYPANPYFCSYV